MIGMSGVYGGTVMTAQIAKVPFHGTEIHTTRVDDEGRVVLKPTIEGMGLAYQPQLAKLTSSEWATVTNIVTVGADGKQRMMATVDLDTWSMLLANINAKKVKAELKPLIVHYQKESAKALRQFWTQGGAINPQASLTQVATLSDRLEEVRIARYKEQIDYRRITHALSAGGASDHDYAQVQETLYLGLFGATASRIRRSRPQVNGERYKIGKQKGLLRPSKTAKNFLNEHELLRLNSAVLMMTSTLDLKYPTGQAPLEDIKVTAMQVAQVAMQGRLALAA